MLCECGKLFEDKDGVLYTVEIKYQKSLVEVLKRDVWGESDDNNKSPTQILSPSRMEKINANSQDISPI